MRMATAPTATAATTARLVVPMGAPATLPISLLDRDDPQILLADRRRGAREDPAGRARGTAVAPRGGGAGRGHRRSGTRRVRQGQDPGGLHNPPRRSRDAAGRAVAP